MDVRYQMGNREWETWNGERERESGNECTAVTRRIIQNGGERERQLSDDIWEFSCNVSQKDQQILSQCTSHFGSVQITENQSS